MLGITSVITFLLLIFGIIVTFYINNLFATHDYDRSVKNIIRIQETLDQYRETLQEKVSDWGVWNDTYDYLKDGNPEYIEINLKPVGFQNLNIQYMVFINPDQSIKSSWSVDLDKGEYATPAAELLAGLLKRHPLPDLPENAAISGYLEIPQTGTVIFAARKVLRNDQSCPSTGILLFGQNLDQRLIAKISQITESSVSLEKPDGDIPFKQVTTFTSADQPPDMRFYYSSPSQILATIPISTYFGEKIGLVYMKTDRESESLGRLNRILFLSSLGFVGAVICVIVLTLINKLVLNRLHLLSSVVRGVSNSSKLDSRIAVSGDDELSDLGRDLNNMFASLQKAQAFLATKDELEAKVTERTEELAKSKKILEEKLMELEKLNKLMIGREMKMAELKEKIRQLENAAASLTANPPGE